MKKIAGILIFLMITFMSLQTYAFVNNTKIEVDLRVEGLKETLMEGKVEADTLIKSIQKLGEQSKVEVIFKNNATGRELYAIGGIEYKKYNINDEWKGYIVRNNQIIEVNTLMNTNLVDKDKIVLYYGNIEDTKRVTEIKESYLNGELSIELSSAIVTWVENDGFWVPKAVDNKLKDINIHLMINEEETIQKTNEKGIAGFKITHPNLYTYYAEGYREGNVPLILKVHKSTKLIGLKDQQKVTRAEFIALLVNYMAIKAEDIDQKGFTDVTDHTLYKSQILVAQAVGIISGNGDGTFRPEQKITMQEVALILNTIYKNNSNLVKNIKNEDLNGADIWARGGIKSVMQKGIIKDTNRDWKGTVDDKTILSILEEKAIKK